MAKLVTEPRPAWSPDDRNRCLSARRELAFRDLIAELARWVPRYVSTCLVRHGALIPRSEHDDLSRDVIQHLAFRWAEGKVSAVARTNESVLRSWTKRVVKNFLIDELRVRRRRAHLPSIEQRLEPDQEATLEARQSFTLLYRALNAEVDRKSVV